MVASESRHVEGRGAQSTQPTSAIRFVVCTRVDLVLIAGTYASGWAALRAYLDTRTKESFRAEKPIRKLSKRLS